MPSQRNTQPGLVCIATQPGNTRLGLVCSKQKPRQVVQPRPQPSWRCLVRCATRTLRHLIWVLETAWIHMRPRRHRTRVQLPAETPLRIDNRHHARVVAACTPPRSACGWIATHPTTPQLSPDANDTAAVLCVTTTAARLARTSQLLATSVRSIRHQLQMVNPKSGHHTTGVPKYTVQPKPRVSETDLPAFPIVPTAPIVFNATNAEHAKDPTNSLASPPCVHLTALPV